MASRNSAIASEASAMTFLARMAVTGGHGSWPRTTS